MSTSPRNAARTPVVQADRGPVGPISEQEVTDAMLMALREANIPPEFIYAFQRTGRIVTEENAKNLSADELAEWDAAVDEYRQRTRARRRWRR